MQYCRSVPFFPTGTSLALTEILCLDSCCDYEQQIMTTDYEPQMIMMSQQCGSSGEESSDETHVHGLTRRKASVLDFTEDEEEKSRIRLQKVEKRKERNKEAARKSNLAKKMFRDNLQKKSTELLEQKLQLEQDIKDLRNQLNHYALLYHQMTHVCTLPQPSQSPSWQI